MSYEILPNYKISIYLNLKENCKGIEEMVSEFSMLIWFSRTFCILVSWKYPTYRGPEMNKLFMDIFL